jgi:hypothetical protein
MGRDGKIAREDPTKVLIFETWFAAGKNFAQTRQLLLDRDPPIIVSVDTLYRYARKYEWDIRANDRELEVAKRLEEEAIEQRTAFLKRMANTGRLLQSKGVAFLQDDKYDPSKPGSGQGGIKTDFAAIQAIRAGLELEKVGQGMADTTVGMQGQIQHQHEVIIRVVRQASTKEGARRDESDRRRVSHKALTDVIDAEVKEIKNNGHA